VAPAWHTTGLARTQRCWCLAAPVASLAARSYIVSKEQLSPDPQPGLDSDGRHWEYTIKLTCGHIACNADSEYKRREHVQKKLSGKHRQVAPPLWQRRGDTFPRAEVTSAGCRSGILMRASNPSYQLLAPGSICGFVWRSQCRTSPLVVHTRCCYARTAAC